MNNKDNKNSVKLNNNPLPYLIGSLILIFSIIFVYTFWNGKNQNAETANQNTNPQPTIIASVQNLQSHTWNWDKTEYNNETTTIETGSSYQLSFNEDMTFNAKIDCNTASGTYTADDTGSIKMTLGPITEAFCGENSKDQEFIGIINAVQDYRTPENGNVLQLNMPAGGPVHFFTPDSP